MSSGFHGSIEALREQSRTLAQSAEARQEWLQSVAKNGDFIQEATQIWSTTVENREGRSIDDEAKIVEASYAEMQDEQLTKAVLCARVMRNAVVGQPDGQKLCFEIVPSVITLLWKTTSFAFESDNELQTFSRALVQLLSNLVTQNEELQNKLWYQTLCIGKKEADTGSRTGADLFSRLLQSSDPATSTAAQVLLLNCTLSSNQRSHSLSTSKAGAKLLRSMLEIVQLHVDNDEKEEEGQERQQALLDSDSAVEMSLAQTEEERNQRQKRYESLGILYTFFMNLFDQQLFGPIFVHLGPGNVFDREGIISLINQPQLSLLKLLDSYLHQGASTYSKQTVDGKQSVDGFMELISSFERLSVWAEGVMKDALNGGSKAKVDPRLVEVHVALILLLQCLITLGMKTENVQENTGEIGTVARELLCQMRSVSFVEKMVSLLHTLAEFAPPISPFRPSTSSSSGTPIQPPPGHALTSTGASVFNDAADNGPSMDNLKRDIVNLLGVLSYRRASDDKDEVQKVQDTVRESGGLFDVMNMTQLDERNPYIRERAIFTLRSLLLGNQASQDLVAQLKPVTSK